MRDLNGRLIVTCAYVHAKAVLSRTRWPLDENQVLLCTSLFRIPLGQQLVGRQFLAMGKEKVLFDILRQS